MKVSAYSGRIKVLEHQCEIEYDEDSLDISVIAIDKRKADTLIRALERLVVESGGLVLRGGKTVAFPKEIP